MPNFLLHLLVYKKQYTQALIPAPEDQFFAPLQFFPVVDTPLQNEWPWFDMRHVEVVVEAHNLARARLYINLVGCLDVEATTKGRYSAMSAACSLLVHTGS